MASPEGQSGSFEQSIYSEANKVVADANAASVGRDISDAFARHGFSDIPVPSLSDISEDLLKCDDIYREKPGWYAGHSVDFQLTPEQPSDQGF